jgi:hypothetical protein
MRVDPGQHQDRARGGPALRELLPWVPTALGVGALIMLLIIAAGLFRGSPEEDRRPPVLPVPAPTLGLPPVSVVPTLSTRPDRPVTASPPRPTRTPARTSVPISTRTSRPASTAPPPAPGPISGRYRVVDSFADGFIGEVLVTNAAGRAGDWRVELRFPAAVGELITSWVESAPQASLRRSGDRYLWSSGVPVPARGQVALRFHFARSGSGDRPAGCTVNDQACSGTG